MATQFCQKCKKAHPGRECDYDDKGECAETADSDEAAKASAEATQSSKQNSGDSKEKRPPKLSV